MNLTNQVELLENSQVKIKITVPEDEVNTVYNDLIKKYCSTVQIKGFRKGKVPSSVLIRKFGESINAEAIQQLVEDSLNEILPTIEHKPFGQKMPEIQDSENLKLELDKDFTYEAVYETFPSIELGDYKGISVEEPEVEILPENVNEELTRLQEQNAMIIEKEEGKIEEGNIVSLDCLVFDENKEEIQEASREDLTFEASRGFDLYDISQDLLGMEKDEEKAIEKSYPEGFPISILSGKTVELKIKIKEIKEKDLPALDDELAQDISEKYETLEDLKKSIREQLSQAAKQTVKNRTLNRIFETLIEKSTISMPKSMVESQLSMGWLNLVRSRFNSNQEAALNFLKKEGKTLADWFKEIEPVVDKQIKSSLILHEIIDKEEIKVPDDDLEAEIQKGADANNLSVAELKERLEKGNHMQSYKAEILEAKAQEFLLDNVTIKKGEKINFNDL